MPLIKYLSSRASPCPYYGLIDVAVNWLCSPSLEYRFAGRQVWFFWCALLSMWWLCSVPLNVCTAFMKSAEPPAGQWLPSAVRARPAIAVSYMLEPINNILYFSCILLWRHLCLFPTVRARHVQPFYPRIVSLPFNVEFLFVLRLRLQALRQDLSRSFTAFAHLVMWPSFWAPGVLKLLLLHHCSSKVFFSTWNHVIFPSTGD